MCNGLVSRVIKFIEIIINHMIVYTRNETAKKKQGKTGGSVISFDGGGLDPKGGGGGGGCCFCFGICTVLIPLQAYSSLQGIRN